MRRIIDPETAVRYYIRRPTGKRVSYKIIKTEGTKYETVNLPELENINRALKTGSITRETADKNINELVNKLYKTAGVLTLKTMHNQDNYKVMEDYWTEVYKDRRVIDKDTARHAIRRAVEAIGELPIWTATKKELQAAVDKHPDNKQRRLVEKLNALLKFIGRDIQLEKARKIKNRVKYLNEKDFKLMLKKVEGEAVKCLHEVCFYTGVRVGEAFALEENNLFEDTNTLQIYEQVDKSGKLRVTKGKNERTSYVFDEGIAALRRWFKLKHRVSLEVRLRIARITKSACKRAFPADPKKHLKFHDLRHSYAIALVSRGVSISLVAQFLGNKVTVCEEYYVGHQSSPESIQMVKRLVKAS